MIRLSFKRKLERKLKSETKEKEKKYNAKKYKLAASTKKFLSENQRKGTGGFIKTKAE